MASENLKRWIKSGEKCALFGLSVKVDGGVRTKQFGEELWCLSDEALDLPELWKTWLGSIRSDDVQDSNLFFLSRTASQAIDVLDGENQRLKSAVWNMYVGLQLASKFAPAQKPLLFTGSRNGETLDVREVSDIDIPMPSIFHPYPYVTQSDVDFGVHLGSQLLKFSGTAITDGQWRFSRVLSLYTSTRAQAQLVERVHQYARCIDGLILPSVGETKRQFKSKTELFIGPKHHQIMDQIYDIRSADEHLHENKYLEGFDREARLGLVKSEAIVEYIVRSCTARIVEDDKLWAHFANTAALSKFWALDPDERKKIWGEPIDPTLSLSEFDPQDMTDAMLGKE